MHLISPDSIEDIESALAAFERVLNEYNFVNVLEDLFEQPLGIEFILSNSSMSTPLTTWLIDKFPTDTSTFASSFILKLLIRLSSFFQFQRLPIPNEPGCTPWTFAHHNRQLKSIPTILDTLSSMIFEGSTMVADLNEMSATESMIVKGKKKSQKTMKRENRALPRRRVDQKILDDFDLSIPEDCDAKDDAIQTVLNSAKSILMLYSEILRSPPVAEAIRMAFIPQQHQVPIPVKPDTEIQESSPSEAQPVEEPSAYPMVQPMKSALHFNSAVGFGEWRILISTRADGDLREASRKDRKTFKIIVKKIKELSNGHFSDDNQKRLNGLNTEIPIFEAKMTRDLRLVYQVDSMSDYESEVERQGESSFFTVYCSFANSHYPVVIRIFGIYTHAQLDSRLWDSIGHQLGKKGKEYKRRCTHRERPVNHGDKVFLPAFFPPLPERETTTTSAVLNLPPDDLEQIHSLLVLEKYLTFSQELLHSILADLDVAFPFQVTQQERDIIEHPHSCYVLGRSGTGKTTTMLFKMLWVERTFQLNNDMVKPRQVFVTKSRVLAGKVEEYFLKLLESLKTASQSPRELKELVKSRKARSNEEENLVDMDDEENWRSDLPTKFSKLLDSHFPLFITFDHLCDLIEADFDPCDRVYSLKDRKKDRAFISYDTFQHEYWPHFSQPLTKGLDPALVFSEMIGIIMGSEETTSCPRGFLDRETYEKMSERAQSTFATQRSLVYSIFEMYQTRKRQRGDYDAADRTHSILRAFNKYGVFGRKIDRLCVDEAQDNLLIDALLLRSLCCNADGLFWAGDTAQTISVGSSFRFDDLKAFLFRIEKRRMGQQPQADELHRSHGGIVNCAHSVIELISTFWPYSIDTLAPEVGVVDGLKPVFLNGWDADNVRYEQFLFGSNGSQIEFGAQQCILVRDDAARQKLREQVGDIGLIMTLYESKGLEFNDVLLFNFFQDSTVDLSQWRIVLTAVDREHAGSLVAPHFSHTRHAGVCAELKFLYVAVTRARKNLWIADQSAKGEPMRTFWTGRDQIHNCTPGTDMPRLAVSSSPEEWASKGKELFDRKQFLQAKHCYERASMAREMAISNAYLLRAQARKIPTGDSRRTKGLRQGAFITAADAFLSCAEEATKNRTTYFRRAGECFEEAMEGFRAANAYVNAHEYDIAAKLFRKLGLFDEAVEVIKTNEEDMRADVVESIKDVARLYYFRESRLEKARELFSTDEEELDYLETRDLDLSRTEVLVSLGRFDEAAELHLSEGRTLDAIPLFLKDEENPMSMQQASSCILQEFWRNMSFGVLPSRKPSVSQLLEQSFKLNAAHLETREYDEITMFRALIAGDRLKLAKSGRAFLEAGNLPGATLCLDHHFMHFPHVKTMTVQELADTSQLFLAYVRILYDLAFHRDPCTSPGIQNLFGILHHSRDEFFIPPETFLHCILNGTRQITQNSENANAGTSVSGWELSRIFRQAVCDHLRRRVSEQNEQCRRAPQFSSCLTHTAFGYCNWGGCLHEHTPPSALTSDWYNARVRIHLQQVLIIQTLHSVGSIQVDLNMQRRDWINRFYEALNPPFYLLGTLSALNTDLIPEFHRGIQVVKDWLRELAYTLNFSSSQTRFLTHVIRGAVLGFAFDRNEASSYLYRSQYLTSRFKPPQYFRPPDGEYMLPELIRSLEGSKVWSIPAGILCLRHILNAKLPINISVLCDFIEFLFASIVLAHGARYRGGFHGVTLPRSWLLRYMTDPAEAATKATHLFHLLIDPLEVLLEEIYTGVGAEYLLFSNQNLSVIPGSRGVFIFRICRALCLLGYNILDPLRLRPAIQKAITSLRRVDRTFPLIYRQYILATRWEQLVRALRSVIQGPLSDELIQMHDLRRAAVPLRLPPGVQFIAYDTYAALLQSIRGQPASSVSLDIPLVQPSSVLSQPTDSSAMEAMQMSVGYLDNTKAIQEDVSGEVAHIEDGIEPDLTDSSPTEIFDLDIPIPASDVPQMHVPSEAEHRAASIIQNEYRRTLRRRRQIAKEGLPAVRQRFFSICMERVHSLGWCQNSQYRLFFLGPLPHILLCLEVACVATAKRKAVAKKELRTKGHEELDEISSRLTKLCTIYQNLIRLQKTLDPGSDLHVRIDTQELKRCVQEAADVLRGLPFTTAEDFRGDLGIAIKGIVAVKKPKPKPIRPTLVWEDEDA